LPDVHLGWRDVTTGAFVTAVLFTLGQQLIGLYLGQSSMASGYAARKLDQYAARKVSHLRGRYSTPIDHH
jgi:hypothetical protein